MSATVIPFPDAIRIPPIPPTATTVRDDRPLLADMAATRRVANMLRSASVDMPKDGQTTAAHWMAEAVEALGVNDHADMMRCMDMAARAWGGKI